MGALTTISDSIHNGQSASCWAAFTPDQEDVYVTDTKSSTISEYRVAASGTLTLLHGVAASEAAGSAPIDVGVSADGAFLYNLNQGAHSITAYSRDPDGSLDLIQTVSGLPATAIAIAVH
jgi:6-phosphogluconolactonase (cycloisomerase 2 family)